jgi:hypothetical protein
LPTSKQKTPHQQTQNQRPKPTSVTTKQTNLAAAALPEAITAGVSSLGSQATTLTKLATPQRLQAMRRISRQHGNGHVQRLVNILQNQEAGETTDEPLNTLGLGVEDKELTGHADQGGRFGIQRAPGDGAAAAAAPPAPTTTANINLQVNAPTIDRTQTMAQISTNHDRENVAGWTTPSYAVDVTSLTATTVDMTVTLDFLIEIASDIPDANAAVIQDHEQAHVIIGERVAQRHLVDDLRGDLQGLATFAGNQPQMQTFIVTASTNFETTEEAESLTYDNTDYPRMREANFAVGVSLADLEAASGEVTNMTSALSMFSTAAAAFTSGMHIDTAHVESAAYDLMATRSALTDIDLARLQYNPEFKALVVDCQQMIDFLVAEHLAGADPAHETLQLLHQTLRDFTWVADPA